LEVSSCRLEVSSCSFQLRSFEFKLRSFEIQVRVQLRSFKFQLGLEVSSCRLEVSSCSFQLRSFEFNLRSFRVSRLKFFLELLVLLIHSFQLVQDGTEHFRVLLRAFRALSLELLIDQSVRVAQQAVVAKPHNRVQRNVQRRCKRSAPRRPARKRRRVHSATRCVGAQPHGLRHRRRVQLIHASVLIHVHCATHAPHSHFRAQAGGRRINVEKRTPVNQIQIQRVHPSILIHVRTHKLRNQQPHNAHVR
jgi:hypothetical protein